MKRTGWSLGIIGILLLLGFAVSEDRLNLDYNQNVSDVLDKLDAEINFQHEVKENVKGASASRGFEIFTEGFTKKERGGKSSRISKHFVCTSCHTIEREDPDLAKIDPQARLEFTSAKGLPFLQGSSMYGIVNRNSFYNDDYEKKYGDLVYAARNDLREAVQLCATECSQGRKMKEWELESVLMYLWTLELKLDDLEINGEEEQLIARALESRTNKKEAVNIIEAKYLKKAPAHFSPPPSEREDRRKSKGDALNGELIYMNGCMYCHENRKYSFFNLDYSKATFRNLEKNLDNYHERSIYQVARYGTKPAAGKRAYMPQYTVEKMSVQQLEDLKSYIIEQSK